MVMPTTSGNGGGGGVQGTGYFTSSAATAPGAGTKKAAVDPITGLPMGTPIGANVAGIPPIQTMGLSRGLDAMAQAVKRMV